MGRVVEVSQRWHPVGAKIGRLRLSEGMVAPWAHTHTEANRLNEPAVSKAPFTKPKRSQEDGCRSMWSKRGGVI